MAGFTLIEAVAALAICAATLVVLLAVRSELMHQSARSGQTSSANVLAGRLIAEWRMGDLNVPQNDYVTGVDEEMNLHWDVILRTEEIRGYRSRESEQVGVIYDCLDVNISVPEANESLVHLKAWRLAGGAN